MVEGYRLFWANSDEGRTWRMMSSRRNRNGFESCRDHKGFHGARDGDMEMEMEMTTVRQKVWFGSVGLGRGRGRVGLAARWYSFNLGTSVEDGVWSLLGSLQPAVAVCSRSVATAGVSVCWMYYLVSRKCAGGVDPAWRSRGRDAPAPMPRPGAVLESG